MWGCVFLRFLSMGVTWLSFSNLFGWVVGGMACLFRVRCQTLRFTVWWKAWDVLFRTCPMMISTQFRFFLKAGASVRCGFSVSFLRRWQLWWHVMPDVGNRDSCEVRRPCALQHRSHPEKPFVSASEFFQIRWRLHEFGCGSIVLLLCFAEWLEFIVRPRVIIHPMTKPHTPCPHGGEFSCPNIRGWMCGWSVKFVPGGRSLNDSRMTGMIIVVQICSTQVALRCFAFFKWVCHDCCGWVICLVRWLVVRLVSSV